MSGIIFIAEIDASGVQQRGYADAHRKVLFARTGAARVACPVESLGRGPEDVCGHGLIGAAARPENYIPGGDSGFCDGQEFAVELIRRKASVLVMHHSAPITESSLILLLQDFGPPFQRGDKYPENPSWTCPDKLIIARIYSLGQGLEIFQPSGILVIMTTEQRYAFARNISSKMKYGHGWS